MSAEPTAEGIIELLALEPLPSEGGWWTQTWRDDHATAIYFLLRPGDFSAMHRLTAPELWHHYAGAPARMLLLDPDRGIRRALLGDDLTTDQRPVIGVPAGVWMGAATEGDWTLLGTTMAPPFRSEDFELGRRAELIERYPAAATDILALTRSGGDASDGSGS